MNSLDTNILVYAVNEDCPEHQKAVAVYTSLLNSPTDWIISDQILFEFYRVMTSARFMSKPLNHSQAIEQIRFLREQSGCLHCAYETSSWKDLIQSLEQNEKRTAPIFDHTLATTLLHNGVNVLYTRNTKDFEIFPFQKLVNPID